MALDLRLEIFAYELFYSPFLLPKSNNEKRRMVSGFYYEEYRDSEHEFHICYLTAVRCFRFFYGSIYYEEIGKKYDKISTSISDFLDFICKTCDRVDLFGGLTIFERFFATCAFVLELCHYSFPHDSTKFIKFAHFYWTMYFDKYNEEFNQKGGWEKLKKVSKSYNTVMEFITYHVIFVNGSLSLLAEIVHDYEIFIKHSAKKGAAAESRTLSRDEKNQTKHKEMSFNEKSRVDVDKLLQKLRTYTFVTLKNIPKITEWVDERNILKSGELTMSDINIANPNTCGVSTSSDRNIVVISEVMSKPVSSSLCHQEKIEESKNALITNMEKSQVLPIHLQGKMSENQKCTRDVENSPSVKSLNKGVVDGSKRKDAKLMINKSRNNKSNSSEISKLENMGEKNAAVGLTTSMKLSVTNQEVSEHTSSITVLKDETKSICVASKTGTFDEKDSKNASLPNSVVTELPLNKNVHASAENKKNIELEYDESKISLPTKKECKNIVEKSTSVKSTSSSQNEFFASIPSTDQRIKEKTKVNAGTRDLQKHAEGVNTTENPKNFNEKEISEQSESLTSISEPNKSIVNLAEFLKQPEEMIHISKVPELIAQDCLNSNEALLRSEEVNAPTMPKRVENVIYPKLKVEKIDNSSVSEAALEKIENIVSPSMLSKMYESAQYNKECKPLKIARSNAQVEIADNSILKDLSSSQNIPLTYSDKKVVRNIKKKNIKNDKSVSDDFENTPPDRKSKDTDQKNVSNLQISPVIANLKTTKKLDQSKGTTSSRILEKSENIVKSSGMPGPGERFDVDTDNLKDASLPENLFVQSQMNTKNTKKSSKKPADEKSECIPLEGMENIQAIIEDDGNLKDKHQSKIISKIPNTVWANSIEFQNSIGTPENITTSKSGNQSDTAKRPKESDKNKTQKGSSLKPLIPNTEDKFLEYLNHIIGRETKDNIENPEIPIQMSSKSRPTELAEFIHQICARVPEDTSTHTEKKYLYEINTGNLENRYTDSSELSEMSYCSKKSNQKIERIDVKSEATKLAFSESKLIPRQTTCDNLDNSTQIDTENSKKQRKILIF
ncbi:uncharacterized protein TNIN_457111 [Trichonephila inaurata madagascariensis]|uniref:Uncharacterized protein n=1 Tax=Trichonephila inaurata madagascariensis TaxID=2747483 RepID=A0A8X7CAB7_9ARAC|nr:uncharacterized protein TNIN_457111 [Trichonephila inaurata madagascariensis]